MAGTQQPPSTAEGNIHSLQKKGLRLGGGLLNYGFIGVDSYLRMKDGESAPVAVGKALLTNAAFSLIPGGIVGGLGIIAAASAPEIMNQLDYAANRLNAKKQAFRNSFEPTEASYSMMQSGLQNMQNARLHAARKMANHARNAQKVY